MRLLVSASVVVLAFAASCRRSQISSSQYDGAAITVEGKIESMQLSGSTPIIVLHPNGQRALECRFPPDRVPELSKLVPSQVLRVHGTVAHAGSSLIVEHSAIEWAGRKPGSKEEDDDD